MNYRLLIVFFFIFSLEARELGDFVKDITLNPIQFELPGIKSSKTESGVEVLSLPNLEFPIVYADILIYHGNKNLGKRLPLVTRLLENTWSYSGSKSYPGQSFLNKLESLGVDFLVSIDYEKTTIHVSYLKSIEPTVLPILKSFLTTPNLTEAAFQNAKTKVNEEILRRNDNPQGLGGRKMREALYFGTVQGSISTSKDIEKIQIKDLEEFQNEILNEPKKLLLLTGDFNLESWNNFFEKTKSTNGKKNTEDLNTFVLEKNIQKFKSEIRLVNKDVQQSFISMVGVIPEHKNKDFYAIQVLNYIIGGGGFNSYFMREIRNNRGLAYSAGSVTNFQDQYGTIQFYAMTKTDSVPEVLSLMKELIQMDLILKLKEEELVRAKNAIVNQFVFQFEDSRRTLLSEVRRRDHLMPDDYLINFRQNIEAVSLEDIKKVGYQYFRNDNLIITIVGPKSISTKLKGKVKILEPEE